MVAGFSPSRTLQLWLSCSDFSVKKDTVKGLWNVLCSTGKPQRVCIWQGSSCENSQRSHCAKLWRLDIDCTRHPKIFEMPELWATFQGKLQTVWIQNKILKYLAVSTAEMIWWSEESIYIRDGSVKFWRLRRGMW